MPRKKRILVIDDSETAKRQYERLVGDRVTLKFLKKVRHIAGEGRSWQERLHNIICDFEPDLIVVDLAIDTNRPVDGKLVVEYIRKMGLWKVVVYSKYLPDAYSPEEVLSWGASDAKAKYSVTEEDILKHLGNDEDDGDKRRTSPSDGPQP